MRQTFQNLFRFLNGDNSDNEKTEARIPPPTIIKMSTKTEVSLVNEYAQKHSKKPPIYEFKEDFIQNRREYTAKCSFDGQISLGKATSKSESKRLAAAKMLLLLNIVDANIVDATPLVQKEPVISNKLEDFDRTKLDLHLDKFLETRETDYTKFRRLFVGDMPENTDEQNVFNYEAVTSPKSKTLEKLKITDIADIQNNNACRVFKEIVHEMNLSYFAEFQETAKNDKYIVNIKLNLNLFTVAGSGDTPEEAIQNSCKTAIEYLHIFNT